MNFFACGVFFLLASLCFVGTYQYLVPKFSGGAVSFSTGDLWQKMLLGFVLSVSTLALGYWLTPYLLMPVMYIAFAGGAFAGVGFLGAALIIFVLTSLFYALQTWIFGRVMSATITCGSFGASLRAGLALGLVSTIIAFSALLVLISNFHID